MLFHILPRGLLLFGFGMISVFAAVVAWQRRKMRGGGLLAVIMTAIALGNFSSGVESMVVGLRYKIIFAQIEYIGFVALPPLLLLFVLHYTGRRKWVSWRSIVLLCIIPAVTLGLTWTNRWHHWIWTGFTPGPPGTNSYIYLHGWWYGVFVVYFYLILVFGIVILLSGYRNLSKPYRQQHVSMISASLIPAALGVIYSVGINPFPWLDLIPIGSAASGLVIVWSIYHFRLLELAPVAREAVVEQLMDPVIVLDCDGVIADLNQAAHVLLGDSERDWLGVSAREVTAFDLAHLTSESMPIEIVQWEGESIFLEPQVSAMIDDRGKVNGQIVLLHDVTVRRQAQLALLQANHQLQVKIEEIQELQGKLRQQAEQDALTGLYNRRYMEDVLDQVLTEADLMKEPVSLVMIDIDHFKNINDHYGHKAGDMMLQRLGRMFLDMIRKGDIACRYGGEEFVIVMPGATAEIARVRAEHWRAAFEDMQVDYRGESLRVTLSAGVAEYPRHGSVTDEVLWAADHALYDAKDAGRNRVQVYSNGHLTK